MNWFGEEFSDATVITALKIDLPVDISYFDSGESSFEICVFDVIEPKYISIYAEDC
jgi:hypothetical protein